jgi:hypothetical protein
MVDKVLLLSNGQMGMYDTPAKVASMLQGMAAKQKANIAQGQTASKLPGQPQAQLQPQIRPQVKKVSDTEVASKVTGSKAVSNNTTGKQS